MDEQLGLSLPLTPEEKHELGAAMGAAAKERALSKAEDTHAGDLAAARLIRDRIAIERGVVTADDVREVFERHRGVSAWGPFMGALFRDRQYYPVGWKASVFASNHGATIRIWKRRDGV